MRNGVGGNRWGTSWRSLESVEGGGEAGEIELGAVEEVEGVGLECTVWIVLEVRLHVVDDR